MNWRIICLALSSSPLLSNRTLISNPKIGIEQIHVYNERILREANQLESTSPHVLAFNSLASKPVCWLENTSLESIFRSQTKSYRDVSEREKQGLGCSHRPLKLVNRMISTPVCIKTTGIRSETGLLRVTLNGSWRKRDFVILDRGYLQIFSMFWLQRSFP